MPVAWAEELSDDSLRETAGLQSYERGLEYLRSDRPLGEDERQLLAQLVTGHWRNRTGRQRVSAGSSRVLEIVAALRKLEADGWKKEAAKEQVASDFGVSRGTVENYEQMTVEREQLLAMLRDANK